MEFNRVTLGIGLLILIGLGFVFVVKPNFSPSALVTGTFQPSNQFLSRVTLAIEKNFSKNPQAVIEQDGRVGLLLPGGNSIQFANDPKTTDQDVVIILNATHTQLPNARVYPEFAQNEFTYVPASTLEMENPYVRAAYPDGFFLMPVNVEG